MVAQREMFYSQVRKEGALVVGPDFSKDWKWKEEKEGENVRFAVGYGLQT